MCSARHRNANTMETVHPYRTGSSHMKPLRSGEALNRIHFLGRRLRRRAIRTHNSLACWLSLSSESAKIETCRLDGFFGEYLTIVSVSVAVLLGPRIMSGSIENEQDLGCILKFPTHLSACFLAQATVSCAGRRHGNETPAQKVPSVREATRR